MRKMWTRHEGCVCVCSGYIKKIGRSNLSLRKFALPQKAWGEGKTVEIDESKIGTRKYNKGHFVEGQWVFGGVERETGRCFLVAVHDRTAETLLGMSLNHGSNQEQQLYLTAGNLTKGRATEAIITLQLTIRSNSLILRLALILILSKLPGTSSKLPCLNIIEKEDLKDISPGTCS
ncbi:putative transposase-like protein [Trichonephila clavipes]|nr:putative transposase-like protein [Trichonephila clavipes]